MDQRVVLQLGVVLVTLARMLPGSHCNVPARIEGIACYGALECTDILLFQ